MTNNTIIVVYEKWDSLGEVIARDARLEGCALPAGAIPVYMGGRPGTKHEGVYADAIISHPREVEEFTASRWTERW